MPRNYKTIFAICKQHGWDYKDKVAEFTEGRTDSLSSLTDAELLQLESELKKFNALPKDWKPKDGNEQRRKMIAIARDMRWDARGKDVMMKRIDEWCKTKTKYKKALNDLEVDELNKVVYIFEHQVKKAFLKNV